MATTKKYQAGGVASKTVKAPMVDPKGAFTKVQKRTLGSMQKGGAVKKAQDGTKTTPTYKNLRMGVRNENYQVTGENREITPTSSDSAVYRTGFKKGLSGGKEFPNERNVEKMGRWEGQNAGKKPVKKGKVGVKVVKKAQNGDGVFAPMTLSKEQAEMFKNKAKQQRASLDSSKADFNNRVQKAKAKLKPKAKCGTKMSKKK